MKKEIIILLLAILILILGLIILENFEKNSEYKGELGEASPRPQNLSVYVIPAIPILTIISPENITYSTSTILLNYSVTNEAESIWYNLDNGINTTINSPAYFSATEGSHILYLYANNSQGASFKSITFSVKIETQPPSVKNRGGVGITENETEQEIPKNTTENTEETPTISKWIIIKFVISLLFLILLFLLVIFLIARIKRKKDRKR